MSILIFAALSAPAPAASCDYLISQAPGLRGQAVVTGFKQLVACDKELAKRHYFKFMQQATELDVLVPLSHAAIDAEIWTPVWEMIGKISDYDARDEVAGAIGVFCAEDPKVVGFLQGAYFALRDIEFKQWDNALVTCQSEKFDSWLSENLVKPPQTTFDEKWATLGRAQIARRGVDALEPLTQAAIYAANNEGPFEQALSLMEESIAQDFGDPRPEDVSALNEALIAVAGQVPAEGARSIADRLLNFGDEAAAAALLPTIYPDRVQPGGGFLYGAVAVEDCAGDEQAYLHAAAISEGGDHYVVTSLVEDAMRSGIKAKLGKCDVVTPWPVHISDQPLASKGELDALLEAVASDYEARGYSVKSKVEKDRSIK